MDFMMGFSLGMFLGWLLTTITVCSVRAQKVQPMTHIHEPSNGGSGCLPKPPRTMHDR